MRGMINEVMKYSFDQSIPVKIVLRQEEKEIVGVVIGGSRYKGAKSEKQLSLDGFYSYTVSLVRETNETDLTNDLLEIEVNNIERAEMV